MLWRCSVFVDGFVALRRSRRPSGQDREPLVLQSCCRCGPNRHIWIRCWDPRRSCGVVVVIVDLLVVDVLVVVIFDRRRRQSSRDRVALLSVVDDTPNTSLKNIRNLVTSS